jgi:hypothetical protein
MELKGSADALVVMQYALKSSARREDTGIYDNTSLTDVMLDGI